MKIKTLFTIVAVVFTSWAVWAGVLDVRFEKNSDTKSQIIFRIDKSAKGAAGFVRAVRNLGKVTDPLVSDIRGLGLAHKCQENPVLFGGLFIFTGVSLCAVGFIIHMVRTDSRFT